MTIGVLAAMDKEFELLSSLKSSKDKQIIVLKCGIGKVNAAVNTLKLISEYKPNIILSVGVAGGLNTNMQIMDTIVGTSYAYHDVRCGKPNKKGQVQGLPESFVIDSYILNEIKELNIPNLHFGQIVSGDCFVEKKKDYEKITNEFPLAKAVDMESTACAQVCYLNNIPFAALRIISDIPLKGDSGKQYNDFWSDLSKNSFEVAKKIIFAL